jgi:hypothetical protein
VTGRFHRDPCLAHVARWIAFRGEALIPDRGMAERFLQRLDPRARCFSFRTFSDTGYTRAGAFDPLERAIHGSLDACWSELVRLNRAGAAISVTINETNGRGRTASDIVRVRALFLDDDRGGDADRFPQQPHLQVRTSDHRCHYYWFVDGLPLETFEAYQQRLAVTYGGDSRVFALNQSMQLPGLWRRKMATEPRFPRLVTRFHGANYPAEAMLAMLETSPDRMRQPGAGNRQHRPGAGG